ncbi:MAG TPA: hypothetical protein ENH55_13425 [Aurantimonas coralicida]|uniref:Uncharacterized protein n=2 Tax=root TaxID=1 RepID=A0A9C9NE49_9HYPH|nr:hypothetical protein [Aurantimonas coralicida]HET99638.1 hypothetical protein [Aurantimonas coralicida]
MTADAPREGYYLMYRVRNGPLVPVRIYSGVTPDPDFPDNPQDRSPVLCALCDGKGVDVDSVWPWCARRPITEAEYRYRLEAAAWDRRHDPASPGANPDEPIDLNRTRPVF